VKGGNMKKEVLEYLKEIGAKGGKATGKSKVRGDSDYYRKLREKGIRKQRGRK
jgi:general stress protein YciG